MDASTSRMRNARVLKWLSPLSLGLVVAALLLVHGESYQPAVSYVPLYLVVSVILTASVALLVLPARSFGDGLCVVFYSVYAFFFALSAFFTGGVSSELYVLFFPLVLASALHGSWRVGLPIMVVASASYALAMLPDALEDIEGASEAALIFFRLTALMLTGVFALAVAVRSPAEEGDHTPDANGYGLLERLSGEIPARREVGVVLVDPGRRFGDLKLLLERVGAGIGEPVLLGDGAAFGLILNGADDRTVEDIARRAVAEAVSLGARKARAGAASYPRDARSAEDLLAAASEALDAASKVDGPGAVVLAGGGEDDAPSYRAAR